MESVIARFLIKIAQVLGLPAVILVETIEIVTKGTMVSGTSVFILVIAAGAELLTFVLTLRWHDGEIQKATIEKKPKGEG